MISWKKEKNKLSFLRVITSINTPFNFSLKHFLMQLIVSKILLQSLDVQHTTCIIIFRKKKTKERKKERKKNIFNNRRKFLFGRSKPGGERIRGIFGERRAGRNEFSIWRENIHLASFARRLRSWNAQYSGREYFGEQEDTDEETNGAT